MKRFPANIATGDGFLPSLAPTPLALTEDKDEDEEDEDENVAVSWSSWRDTEPGTSTCRTRSRTSVTKLDSAMASAVVEDDDAAIEGGRSAPANWNAAARARSGKSRRRCIVWRNKSLSPCTLLVLLLPVEEEASSSSSTTTAAK